MREDLLHFVWKYQKFSGQSLMTTDKITVQVKNPGTHNHGAGPDFFNARLLIGGQEWAGNVELHVKSSDWYAHGHENDLNYNNVVLHVVWEDDVSVFRKDGSAIATLVLKDYLSRALLMGYRKLLEDSKKAFINCEQDIASVDGFLLDNWLERLFFERLEQKSAAVFELLDQCQNDWEKVLFSLLMKSFGSKVNGEAFLDIARILDFSIVRKVAHDALQLEALLFGTAGLLHEDHLDAYHNQLKQSYGFLENKFNLGGVGIRPPAFYGLRPNNFPTLRLSQVAVLYHKVPNLFSEVVEAKRLSEIVSFFEVSAGEYWNSHYTFGKTSKESKKRLTKNFIELLVVNAIVPIKFCYAKQLGKNVDEELVEMLSGIKPEQNGIIEKFKSAGLRSDNALHTQAKIQLYNHYCTKNKCLQCAVGTSLLNGNF